jgi:hypothetical protein
MNRIDEPLLQSGISSSFPLKNVFADWRLQEDSVIRNFRVTAADGKSRDTGC